MTEILLLISGANCFLELSEYEDTLKKEDMPTNIFKALPSNNETFFSEVFPNKQYDQEKSIKALFATDIMEILINSVRIKGSWLRRFLILRGERKSAEVLLFFQA